MCPRKTPVFIKSTEMVVEVASSFGKDKYVVPRLQRAPSHILNRICPIFQVSNVTGQGLDHVWDFYPSFTTHLMIYFQLRTFLNLLPSSENDTDKFLPDQPLEVQGSLPSVLVSDVL